MGTGFRQANIMQAHVVAEKAITHNRGALFPFVCTTHAGLADRRNEIFSHAEVPPSSAFIWASRPCSEPYLFFPGLASSVHSNAVAALAVVKWAKRNCVKVIGALTCSLRT